MANRGIPGVLVRFGGVTAVTYPDGSFLLRTVPGKQLLHAAVEDYEEIEPPLVSTNPGRRTWAEVRMNRTRFGYGHVVASIAVSQSVESMAISPNDIYFTEGRDDASAILFRIPKTGGPKVQLGTLSLSPIEKNPDKALMRGSPHLHSVKGGMAWVDGVMYGIADWPGRLFRVSTTGELTLQHPLAIEWPTGVVFDGKRFWFLENNEIENRYGIHAIDGQTGQTVSTVPSRDTQVSGLAWGLDRFWVSSLEGHVYEIDIARAVEKASLEAGRVNRFSGEYCRLGFCDGYLWGLDRDAQRLCKIKVRADQ
jgi:hypothetical protein